MKILLLCILITLAIVANGQKTPLELFVERPDEGTSYHIVKTYKSPKYTAYALNFTSLNWLTAEQSSNPRWWHWLTICVPNVVLSDYAFFDVNSGTYDLPVLEDMTIVLKTMCEQTNSVSAQLLQVPNQPLILENDGVPRIEDAILAYSWRKFMENTSNTDWIGQFPLVKSVVRAMDTVQEFMKSKYVFYRVNNFVVSGASKRGWTSWLTAAVDPRVKAVVPMVMPFMNIIQNTNNHYRSYGGYSYAYADYVGQGLMKDLNGPKWEALAKQIDPINYIDKLMSKKKLIISMVGDEFFIPDSINLFWPQLLGTKHIRMHPNAGHSANDRYKNIIPELVTYFSMVANHQKLPEFDWSIVPDPTTNTTTIHLVTKDGCNFQRPSKVVVWQADTVSTTKRDWRYKICPTCAPQNITWVESKLEPVADDVYRYTISAPTRGGWRGAFVELTFNSLWGEHIYTTDFMYAPFNFPFENCGHNCGNGTFPA